MARRGRAVVVAYSMQDGAFRPHAVICFRKKLCACGAFYLPALRATLFQKRAYRVSPVAAISVLIGAKRLAGSAGIKNTRSATCVLPPLKGEGDRVSGGGVTAL